MAVTGNRNTGQPTATPTRKVAGGGIAGAITVLLVWLYNQYVGELPPEIASAITTIVSFVAAYVVPPSDKEMVLPTAPSSRP